MRIKRTYLAAAVLWLSAVNSAHALDKVSIGNLPASSSWCFIIAEEKGYFRAENIDATHVTVASEKSTGVAAIIVDDAARLVSRI